jgi:hypothetical protein
MMISYPTPVNTTNPTSQFPQTNNNQTKKPRGRIKTESCRNPFELPTPLNPKRTPTTLELCDKGWAGGRTKEVVSGRSTRSINRGGMGPVEEANRDGDIIEPAGPFLSVGRGWSRWIWNAV